MRVIGELDYELLQPVREDAVALATNKSLAASGSDDYDISCENGYSAIIFIIRVTYNAAATSGCRVRWMYSANGSDYDTDEGAENQGNYTDLKFSAGATDQETIVVPIFAPYVRIQVANLDAAHSLTYSAWYILLR